MACNFLVVTLAAEDSSRVVGQHPNIGLIRGSAKEVLRQARSRNADQRCGRSGLSCAPV